MDSKALGWVSIYYTGELLELAGLCNGKVLMLERLMPYIKPTANCVNPQRHGDGLGG